MQSPQSTLRMPDLDLGATAAKVSVWHAKVGRIVEFRQRLVEVTAGDVLVDLPAPATGMLAECCVAEDDPVVPGQVLAVIDVVDDSASVK